jgi:hypothetical protein
MRIVPRWFRALRWPWVSRRRYEKLAAEKAAEWECFLRFVSELTRVSKRVHRQNAAFSITVAINADVLGVCSSLIETEDLRRRMADWFAEVVRRRVIMGGQ